MCLRRQQLSQFVLELTSATSERSMLWFCRQQMSSNVFQLFERDMTNQIGHTELLQTTEVSKLASHVQLEMSIVQTTSSFTDNGSPNWLSK